ncbi:MAG TPA: TraI/MobA(P) family conjugative relaxase, partial [Bdellovibrio sp.]|nr:TraI/MobA(P) family conjugative relaxase [Bdellovibrio sp.]
STSPNRATGHDRKKTTVISKRIDRKNNTSDFERLGCYILEAKTQQDAILWTQATDYSPNHSNHKVLSYRITHCEAEIPAMAIAEILLTQAQNTRSKADKTYHLVASFPDGESPTLAQLEDIEDEFCKALGFSGHQRLSAVHQDTDNLHLHIAINKVHPQNFKVIEPYRDFYILSQTCRLLEQRHGLQVDNGMDQKGNKQQSPRNLNPDAQQSFLRWIQENLRESLIEVLSQAQGWNDLHEDLGPYGLTIKPRGAGLVIALTDGSLSVKASNVLKDLSFKKSE